MWNEYYDEPHALGLMRLTGGHRGYFYANEQQETVPDEENQEQVKYRYDIYLIDDVRKYKDDLAVAKSIMLGKIADYDSSDNVNRIYVKALVGGKEVTIPYWRDRDDRNALKRSAEAVKAAGRTTYVLELGSEYPSLEVDVDKLLSDLDLWEVYAQDCYCDTADHQRNVLALSTAEEVCKYDYKAGYPEIPTFDFSE